MRISRFMPWILRGLGIGLAGGACIETGRSCVRASKIIEEKGIQDEPLKVKAKETWKEFIMPAVLFGASVGCHVGADRMLIRKLNTAYAAVASVVATSQLNKDKMEETIKEVVGHRNFKKIVEKSYQNTAKEHMPDRPNAIKDTGYGNALFYEPLTGNWFYSSYERIVDAKIAIKQLYDSADIIYVNDAITEFGLNSCHMGKYYGWSESQDGERVDIGWIGSGSEDDRYENPETGEYVPYSIITYSIWPVIQCDKYGF